LPENISSNDSGLSLYDQRHDSTCWPSF
jgi:hypothetical protein